MIIVREALLEDLPACAALRASYTTRETWQLTVERSPVYQEVAPLLNVRMQQVRLPRSLVLTLPSAGVPLDTVWESYSARLVATAAPSDDTPPPLLGYLMLQLLPDQQQAWIARLLVDAPARGKGVGRVLIRAARSWAAAQGLSSLLAHVPLRNVGGGLFYQRCGFRICGLSEHFYPTREDALLLASAV